MSEQADIRLGDCLDLMQDVFPESIDMILTDLPYGTTQCSWDSLIDLKVFWGQVNRIMKPDGVFVSTAQQPFTSELILSNIKHFRYCWVWEKSKATGFLNAKKRPLVAHEDIVVFSKKPPIYFPQMSIGDRYNKGVRKAQTPDDVYGSFKQVVVRSEGQRYPRSVVYFKTAESESATFHKTQKPVALMEYLIKTYTQEGDTVLDPCMGSGTTGVACVNTNRNFIGFEKDSLIFESAKQRITSQY